MVESKFDLLKARASKLSELIETEQYEDAKNQMEQLDTALRALTRDELASLDESQRDYLYKLATQLVDREGEMRERKTRLMDVIAPLNANSTLKPSTQYQDKRSNG